jgi:hypothetical protein
MRYSIHIMPCLISASAANAAGLLDQVPVDSATLRGSAAELANCAFVRLDQTGLHKVDLPGEVRLTLEGSTRHWQLIFRQVGKTSTTVEFTRANTLFGPLGETSLEAARLISGAGACITVQF